MLDLFFSIAVPFIILCVIVAKVALAYNADKGIYQGAEGAHRRDAINEQFRTNRGAIVVAVIFVLLWALTLWGLIESWGATFFTFVIGFLMIIPFMAVCAGVIMIYMFAVHAYANAKYR